MSSGGRTRPPTLIDRDIGRRWYLQFTYNYIRFSLSCRCSIAFSSSDLCGGSLCRFNCAISDTVLERYYPFWHFAVLIYTPVICRRTIDINSTTMSTRAVDVCRSVSILVRLIFACLLVATTCRTSAHLTLRPPRYYDSARDLTPHNAKTFTSITPAFGQLGSTCVNAS